MRILTVRQPAAWAIIHAGKDVENRTRSLGQYRGPVAIVAGREILAEDHPFWEHPLYRAAVSRETAWVRDRLDVRGAIIGVVDLIDVHSASVIGGCGYLRHDCPEHGTCRDHCSPWAEGPAPRGGWMQHLVLANPRPLAAPIPYKGALGLRTLDAETYIKVWEAIA